ncbi:MAG: hypothetical protein K2X91_10110, partial [Thermoleophilia bacterium]|nr:hypothetical protein [Thermoleophilia bacterium]
MTAQTPFIDPATIDDLSAALADARRAADGALARDAALALEAAFAANAGRLGAARERTAQAVRNAADPRILFFGFQSFFRSAVAPGVPEDRKAADLATAESLCRRRLDAAQASGDRAVECRAHTNLALVLHYRQRPDAAATHYRGSVELARILGDPRSLARSLGNYANFLETGRPPVTRDELLAAAGLYAGAIAAA